MDTTLIPARDQERSTQEMLLFMDLAAKEINAYSPSMEGFAQAVTDASVRVVDTFAGLVNTMRRNLTRLNYDTKRSEMRKWSDSNVTKMALIRNLPYSRIMNVSVAAPSGMKGTYNANLEALTGIYRHCGMKSAAESYNLMITRLQKQVALDPTKVDEAELRAFIVTLSRSEGPISQLVQEIAPTGPTAGKLPLKIVVKSTAELVHNVNMLLDMEKQILELGQMLDLCEDANKRLAALFADGGTAGLNPKYLQALATATNMIAWRYEKYSTAALYQMSVESNYTQLLETVFAER